MKVEDKDGNKYVIPFDSVGAIFSDNSVVKLCLKNVYIEGYHGCNLIIQMSSAEEAKEVVELWYQKK